MADKPVKEKKEEKKDGVEGEASAPKTRSTLPKNEKKVSRWTADTCLRYAKRFQTKEEWFQGHPSSYKAAMSKGWEAKCTAHMKNLQKFKAPPKAKKEPPSTGRRSA